MKIFLSLLIIVLSIVGITDSGFITYEKFSGIIPECGVGFDCGKVLNSEWANIGPVPLSVIGVFFYLAVLILGILNFLEYDLNNLISKLTKKIGLKNENIFNSIKIHELILLLSIFGFIFSIYLVFLMAVIIEAWCKYCLISAFTSTSIFVVSSIYNSKLTSDSSPFFKKIIFNTVHFLYTKILKNIFFLFDAELIHDTLTNIGKFFGSNRVSQFLTSSLFSFSHRNLKRKINGIIFKNPVGLSAGFDYNGDLTQILPSVGFGFHTIGSVSLEKYGGNAKPRLGRFLKSKSLLVNKGIKSLGAVAIVQKLSGVKFSIPTGISISSTNKKFNSTREQIYDILQSFIIFEKSDVKHSYYELNISCPNTFGGEPFTSPKRLEILLTALEKINISKPIFIKMPIDQSKKETLLMLNVVNKFRIAGVIFGNLTKDKNNPDVNSEDLKQWKLKEGNLSGKPTWHRSNDLIKLTKKTFKNRFTIIGTGGIFSGKDALEKISYGADLIQLITGMIFEGPELIGEINLELSQKALNKRT